MLTAIPRPVHCVLLADQGNPVSPLAQTSAIPTNKDLAVKKKDEAAAQEMTPLEKMLQNAGPLREDGSDRFYGFENVR